MRRNFKTRTLRKCLTSAAIVAVTLSATTAKAQDQEGAENENAGDVIVVTGSRITNPNLELSSPVNVIGRDQIDLAPSLTAEELIRELPGVVPGLGSSVNNGSEGAAELDLRGLGSNRNIVLIDGSRVVPAGLTGVTDTNNIPLALVERVDIVTGGGGTVYGADAISGVVNFVLKRDFEGAEISASYGLTERGDADVFRTDLTLGGNFADGRGNAVLNIGYHNSDPLFQDKRSFGVFALNGQGERSGSGTSVPTAINGDQYDPITGLLSDDTNTFNFNPFNLYQTPLERINIFAAAHYEVAEGIEVYAKGLYSENTVGINAAPSGLFGTTYNLPLSNPFLTDALRNQICAQQGVGLTQAQCDAAAGVTDPNAAGYQAPAVTINRRLVELGNRREEIETNVFQVEAGVRGDISDSISWDVKAIRGESERVRAQQNNGLRSRVQQALFAIDADNCVDPSNGCVPINLFGPTGQDISADFAAFAAPPVSSTTKTELTVVTGAITGDAGFALPWAGTEVNFAVGVEYRENKASIIPDLPSGTPDEVLGNGETLVAQSGDYSVKEVFGELVIPLVEDQPFFRNLTIELGGRYSDYSNTGGNFTWKAGGSWEPVDGLKFRGIYQRAVRSPNIEELFRPVTTGLDNLTTDPCEGALPVGNAQLTAVCIAQGAPAGTIGFIPTPSAGQINVTSGGNADLDVEKARTITVGAIIQPAIVPGLTVTFDYYDIRVTDAISFPVVDDIVGGCFDNPSVDNPTCALIQRNPLNGSLNGGSDTPGLIFALSNLGTLETSGLDFGINYNRDIGFAELGLQVNGNFTFDRKFQASPSSIARECAGFYSVNCPSIQPEFQLNSRISLSRDESSISLGWRHISGQDYEPGAPATIPDFESINSYNIFDVVLQTQILEKLDLTFVVDNLFDKKPPIIGDIGAAALNNGNTYPSTYDALGRRYTIGAKFTF